MYHIFKRTSRLYPRLVTRRNIIVLAAITSSVTLISTTTIISNDDVKSRRHIEIKSKPSDIEEKSLKDQLLSKILTTEQIEIDQTPQNTQQEDSTLITTLQRKPEYLIPKNPIVLCHGLSGFDRIMILPSLDLLTRLVKGEVKPDDFVSLDDSKNGSVSLEYWYGIQEELQARGSTVFVAKVPGFGSIEERASRLDEFIKAQVERIRTTQSQAEVYNDEKVEDQKTPKEAGEKLKINLVAHSMGGLDSRYLIDKFNKQSNYEIVSLTTVVTPHRGSEMADFVVDLVQHSFTLPTCIYQLTTKHMAQFNEIIKDSPDVQYFSYGAAFNPAFYNVFFATWNIINQKAGDNDGMVSVRSAKWGTYLGTLKNVDHLDLINWNSLLKKVGATWITGSGNNAINGDDHMKEKIVEKALSEERKEREEDKGEVPLTEAAVGIDTVALYLNIADNLARRGL